MIEKALKSFIIQFGGSILGFLFQFLAARFLGAEEYGKFNYYFGFIGAIGVFFFFGFSYYLPRVLHKSNDKNLTLSKLLVIYFIILFLFSPLIIFGLKVYLNNLIIAILIILGILGFSLIEIMRSFLVSDFKAVEAAFYKSFLLNAIMIILFLFFFQFNQSFWLLLGVFILAHLIIVLPFVFKRFSLVKPEWNIIKGVLPFYLVQVLYTTYAYVSKVFQGEFQSFEMVGILSISIVIGKIISMLGTNFSLVLMPEFSKAWEEGDTKRINKYFNQISRINIFIISPLSIFLILNTHKILAFLGKGYEGGEIIFILILLSSTITAFVGPNGAVLLMTGNVRKEIINGCLMLFTGVTLGLLFGRSLFYGIALSIAASEILIAISKRIMTYKLLKVKLFSSKEIGFILIIVLIQIITFYFSSMMNNLILWGTVNSVLLIIFIIMNFVLSPNKEDYEMVKNVINRFKSLKKY